MNISFSMRIFFLLVSSSSIVIERYPCAFWLCKDLTMFLNTKLLLFSFIYYRTGYKLFQHLFEFVYKIPNTLTHFPCSHVLYFKTIAIVLVVSFSCLHFSQSKVLCVVPKHQHHRQWDIGNLHNLPLHTEQTVSPTRLCVLLFQSVAIATFNFSVGSE